ncbi:MAG: methionine--tRNA ligase [Synergistaceae bacterium]|nr:methionine--tRNA ligase [Synergistaceae bacterium]
MSEKFYITTPIYYVNDIPHIGHAYTTIACDVMARYKRMKGCEVFFLTGTDEHGQKIQQAAASQNTTPQELVDRIHMNFRNLWQTLNISNSDFIRTTEQRHIDTVQAVFSRLIAQGDIYKGKYSGYYCVPCETYVPENAMGENHTCPDCGRPLTLMEEESYFFRASKYVPELIAYYEAHPEAIKPKIRYNEVMSFLRSGVRDQSVSRTSLKWGIPVPGDDKHVIYVWFDALINYLSALGYPDGEKFAAYWPEVRHMVGKDIIRFHCVTWPLMLLALGLPLPREIVAHGWWTVDGQKMSKSLKNVVDPVKMTAKYGLDAFRYFLMREVPFGNDGDFSELALVGRINSDLANDLGNLLNRTLQMIQAYRGGVVPSSAKSVSALSEMLPEMLKHVDESMKSYAYDEALKAIWEYISRANKFIDETTPWILAKDSGQSERLDWVLLNLYEALRVSALMIAPFMPDTAKRVYEQLGQNKDPVTLKYDAFVWGAGAGAQIHKGEILFPRIDIEEWKKLQTLEAEKANVIEKPEAKPEIGIEDFGKVEMRVAEVTKCEEIPKSKKLYKLEVNLGYETRTVCSGIKAFFTPEELVGKRIILVTNLKPVKLCGVESNGMVLCASVKHDGKAEQLTILTPEKDIPLGSLVS